MPPSVVTGIRTAMTEHHNKQSGAQHLKTNKTQTRKNDRRGKQKNANPTLHSVATCSVFTTKSHTEPTTTTRTDPTTAKTATDDSGFKGRRRKKRAKGDDEPQAGNKMVMPP